MREPKKARSGSERRATKALADDRLDALVARAKAGEVAAFEELYGEFGRKILNYIFRMTSSREEAEDLTQDTFVLAFRNIGSLKENRKFQSWLFRIAQNNVFQKYRGKTPQMESIDQVDSPELSELQRLTTPMKSPEQKVLAEELEQLVEEAVRALPEKYRQVFVLSAIHKLSYLEISEIVGRSLASVKSDIHRARVEVRDKIKRYLGENYGMSSLF